jgi:hypothetical protein
VLKSLRAHLALAAPSPPLCGERVAPRVAQRLAEPCKTRRSLAPSARLRTHVRSCQRSAGCWGRCEGYEVLKGRQGRAATRPRRRPRPSEPHAASCRPWAFLLPWSDYQFPTNHAVGLLHAQPAKPGHREGGRSYGYDCRCDRPGVFDRTRPGYGEAPRPATSSRQAGTCHNAPCQKRIVTQSIRNELGAGSGRRVRVESRRPLGSFPTFEGYSSSAA